MLSNSKVTANIPAADLERARSFYADKLGLEPVDEREGGLLYETGGQEFALFASTGRASGDHTQLGFVVPDLDVAVRELRERGVVFEEYDLGGLPVQDGIVEIDGYYPSRAPVGERAIWFHDSEGNLLGISQPIYD
jgi:catechol 2,3-dioxygenase-like lactoylglutathione lyase family enzyme